MLQQWVFISMMSSEYCSCCWIDKRLTWTCRLTLSSSPHCQTPKLVVRCMKGWGTFTTSASRYPQSLLWRPENSTMRAMLANICLRYVHIDPLLLTFSILLCRQRLPLVMNALNFFVRQNERFGELWSEFVLGHLPSQRFKKLLSITKSWNKNTVTAITSMTGLSWRVRIQPTSWLINDFQTSAT